jgi:hypothetical protein
MTDEALEAALSLFAHAGTKQAVVVRSREHHWTTVWREARPHCEIPMQGSPSHGENMGSSRLGSANKINGLISKFLRVSRLCPVESCTIRSSVSGGVARQSYMLPAKFERAIRAGHDWLKGLYTSAMGEPQRSVRRVSEIGGRGSAWKPFRHRRARPGSAELRIRCRQQCSTEAVATIVDSPAGRSGCWDIGSQGIKKR